MMTTPDQRASIMDKVINPKVEKVLSNLYSRWQDEKKFEDFEEYKKIIENTILAVAPKNTKVLSISKTFRIKLNVPGFPYYPIVYFTSREFGWTSK